MATITGTNASDPELEGTNLADQIFGLGGNDILIGFDGDDVLEGGKGADQLFGSLGFDTASYKGSQAGVTVVLAEPSSSAVTPLATRCSASRACAARRSRTFFRVTISATSSTVRAAPTASTGRRRRHARRRRR